MFKVVSNLEDLIKVFVVRGIVFLEEQKVSYAIEHDEDEYLALHILGEEEGEPIAAGRIRFLGEYAKLERIAVRKEYRGRALGHQLTQFMIQVAEEKGFSKQKMHAQAYLKEFYEKLGFKVVGEKFKEADIEHFLMIRS